MGSMNSHEKPTSRVEFNFSLLILNKFTLNKLNAKFQTYFADSRAKKNSPIYDILKQCELNETQFEELAEFCKNVGCQKLKIFFIKKYNILNNIFSVI